MEAVFLFVLRLSAAACPVILAALLVRFLLRRAPKWLACLLWVPAGLRLLCPVFPESGFSLLPRREAVVLPLPGLSSSEAVRAAASASAPSGAAEPAVLPSLAAYLWLAGVCLLLVYALASWLRLRKRVSAFLPLEKDVRACDEAEGPFILGILRPRICLPSSLGKPDLDYVLAHERAHLLRRDHWWKPLGYLLLAVHWFNPLCWLAFGLFCRDLEAACDERVIRDLDREGRAAYAQALLDLSSPRRLPAACPLAFGETGVKGRIRGILNRKRPAFWVLLAAAVLCLLLVLCFLTDPLSMLPKDAAVESAYFLSFSSGQGEESAYIPVPPELAEELRQLLLSSGKRRFYGRMVIGPGLDSVTDLNLSDGITRVQVLYDYYSGYSFLRGQEDDYRTIVTVLGGSAGLAGLFSNEEPRWLMSDAFDKAFQDWQRRMLAAVRTESAPEAPE